jgi:hypothetical protein
VKIGGENSKKTILAIGLAVVAVILTVRMFYSSFAQPAQETAQATPSVGTVAPTPNRKGQTRARGPQPKKNSAPTTSLDPRLHLSALTETETIQYDGTGRNIFKSNAEEPRVEIPKQVASGFKKPQPQQPIVEGPPPPPPPPPIPLKFFGFASQQGNKKVLLLSDGDVFVAQEGDIVQRRYKIMKINANNIEVQDVLSNNRQTIPLTAG